MSATMFDSTRTRREDVLSGLQRELGERVRGLRRRRGMTRRQLAAASGVSERYLAQLECGRANPSLEVLWKVSEALGENVPGLLAREPAGAERPGAEELKLARALLATLQRVAGSPTELSA